MQRASFLDQSRGSSGFMSVREDCRGPYFTYMGNMAAYKEYLTSEFHAMVHGLTVEFNWREVKPTARLNETTWEDIMESSRTPDGCVPEVMMFVIQYHWEFINLAHLGPRPAELNNTVM